MIFKRTVFFLLAIGFCATLYASSLSKDNPRNLIVPPESATQTSVTLLWDKPQKYAHVSAYNIYQDGKHIATTDKTNYTIRDLSPDRKYEFFIKAKRPDGHLSTASKVVEARTKPVGKILNITDYGAKSGGTILNTKAIQQAINKCPAGGTVYIPSGTFMSGALYLKSNMTLYIAKGGILKGSTHVEDYLR